MSTNQIPWEDHLLERTTERDLRDIRRTAVAFANSVRPDHIAAILVGECNDGTVPGVTDPDEFQRKIRIELEKIYPAIEWRQSTYENSGRTCIRIEIAYDGDTPHFGDAAWIRQGSETLKASDAMLQKLIEMRQSKVRKLTEWLNREVTVSWSNSTPPHLPNWGKFVCTVVNVTSHFATFEPASHGQRSEPISWLDLSWDDECNRLRIFVNPQMSVWR